MDRSDHLDHVEHLDKDLVDELAQVARETVRDELREQTRKQRRTATLYAASGAAALYAGAALALAIGLALALGLPDWAAALITAAVLGAVAYLLRGAARPSASRPETKRAGELRGAGGRVVGDTPSVGSADRTVGPYPPVPPVPPIPPVPPDGAGGAPGAGARAAGSGVARPDYVDPEAPHHRAR